MTKLEINKPKFGELTKIASDLYWAHFELPFRLNHVNLFLMDTPTGWFILDAGLKSDHSEEHWEALINWNEISKSSWIINYTLSSGSYWYGWVVTKKV